MQKSKSSLKNSQSGVIKTALEKSEVQFISAKIPRGIYREAKLLAVKKDMKLNEVIEKALEHFLEVSS